MQKPEALILTFTKEENKSVYFKKSIAFQKKIII
jgi:hypothetical protein